MPDRKPAFLRRPKFTRVDLVDRGANQDAHIVFYKRSDDADKGVSSTPTDTEPKTQNPPKGFVARMVEAVAKMMGRRAMTMDQVMVQRERERNIYDKEWQFQSAFRDSVESIMNDGDMDMEKRKLMLRETMEQYHQTMLDHMKEMMDLMESSGNSASLPEKGGDSMYKAQDPDPNSASSTDVNKKEGEAPMTFDEYLKSLSPEERAKVEGDLAKRYAPAKIEIPEEITKRLADLEATAGQVAELKKQADTAQENLKKAQDNLAKEREIRITREYLEKAAKYPSAGSAEEVSKMLRQAYDVSEDFGKQLEASLGKTEAQLAQNAILFKEFGRHGNTPEPGSAEEKITKRAKEMFPTKSEIEAEAEFLKTAEGKRLYAESLVEKGGK